MPTDAKKRLLELQERQKNLIAEEVGLEAAIKEFPDLRVDTDRWGRVRYYAKSANPRVTDCTFSHSCGCCDDALLLAHPFLVFSGLPIYSDPPFFTIGERYEDGDRMDLGCFNKLKEVGIPEILADKFQEYYNAHQPTPSEEEE